jgi:16S rRNA (uracil1498-N3)-methyltransferase
MSPARFYCAELTPGVITLDPAESRHALQSLRLRPGDEVMLFDGQGRLAHGVLLADAEPGARRTRRPARLTVDRVLCEPPPAATLTLVVAGCKGPRLAWMVEKLTELGTTRIVLAEFDRSVVHVGAGHADRLRRTAVEAAKQSQRVWLPDIRCGASLAQVMGGQDADAVLIAHPADEAAALSAHLHGHRLWERRLLAVVGPEGGLTTAELTMLREAHGELVRLAPGILRVETAAISIAANWAAHQGR